MYEFKQLAEEMRPKLVELWQAFEAKGVDNGNGDFEVVMTSESVDRDGDVILADGWDFSHYLKNPVVLWGHDFLGTPIGKVTEIRREGNSWIAKGVFASTDKAQECRKLYDEGILKTVSVGFIIRKRKGNVIEEKELLELSFVPIPSNRDARSLRAMQDLEGLMKKDAPIEEKGVLSDVHEAIKEQTWEVMEEKWKKYSDVARVTSALYEVWTRPEVGMEQFDDLLKEAIDLLSGLLGSRGAVEGKVADSAKNIDAKAVMEAMADAIGAKAGRVISSQNRKKISEAVAAMGSATTALQTLLDETDAGEEKNTDADAQKQIQKVPEKKAMDDNELVKVALQSASKGLEIALNRVRKM